MQMRARFYEVQNSQAKKTKKCAAAARCGQTRGELVEEVQKPTGSPQNAHGFTDSGASEWATELFDYLRYSWGGVKFRH